MEKHFYHFATKGLEDDILFGSVEEFIAGMNRIALCLCRLGKEHLVIVICFCLMDNHVHFILYGTEEDCILFMENYVNPQVLERQFDSVRDYQFVLNKRVEEEINLEMYNQSVSVPDGEVRSRARDMAGKLFGNRQVTALSARQRLDLARLLKRETGAAAKQIARVVHLKLAELEPILNPRRG